MGIKDTEPVRVITVECKGSHGVPDAQHVQLAKAAAQVHAVVIGDVDRGGAPPPSLLLATSLAGRGGIEMRILDPAGDGMLVVPERRTPTLNGSVEQFNELPEIPHTATAPDGKRETRPGFYIPPKRSEWFLRVLTKTAAAGLLAFSGDRTAAGKLLTPRQQARVGSTAEHPSTAVICDTGITLGGLSFVGTDHVFRLGSQRIEAFSGMLQGLHQLLADDPDIQGYESALPGECDAWRERSDDATADWGGVLEMDADGAVLGLRTMGAGRDLLSF